VTLKPPAPGANLAPGYRLDRYELLAPIATGGMASVWVGRQIGKHGFEKLVAIKTILPQYATDLRFQKMFLDEAHIAAGIEHQNVAQILDLGEEHDVLYIVMEFVDGDALSKLNRACDKRNVKIPQGVLLRVLADACSGLHAAHELREKDGTELHVVHRDVSPQNILVSAKGIAKVIDFGIAKARDRAAGETGAGLLKGKIHYMPPEQALGKHVDRRADVWAIGAILYHLLAGRLPFDAENQLATLHLLTSGRPPIPLPPSIPQCITKVVRRAMAFDMEKRFPTCAELGAAIEGAMVEANLRASTHDVASFLVLHLADRQEQRKQAIDLALKAAADRARMAQLLKPPAADSVSGFSPNPMHLAPLVGTASAPGVSEPGRSPSSSGVGSFPEASSPSLPSNATLGSAALEAGPQVDASARRRRGIFIMLGAGALVAAITIGVVLGRGKSSTTSPGSQTTTETKPKAKATETAATTTATATTTTTATVATGEPTTTTTASASADATSTVAATKPTTKWVVKGPAIKPTTTATATATATVKKKVDDGF
jgi:serine/threonine-protein kinase